MSCPNLGAGQRDMLAIARRAGSQGQPRCGRLTGAAEGEVIVFALTAGEGFRKLASGGMASQERLRAVALGRDAAQGGGKHVRGQEGMIDGMTQV